MINDPVAFEITCCTTYAVYEPAMMNSPCAMLMTPICPNVRDNPNAANRRIDPILKPVNNCPITTSMTDAPPLYSSIPSIPPFVDQLPSPSAQG